MHINKISLQHFQAWHSFSQTLKEKWTPPPPNLIKTNFNTAIQDSFSAQAAVRHNDKGHIIHATS
jgi:hypothetical protein